MKKYILLSIIFIIFSSTVFSKIGSSIKGVVLDEKTNLVINGVVIYLKEYTSDSINYKAVTNKDGVFVLNDVPPSKYYISYFPPSPYAYDRVEREILNTSDKFIVVYEGKNIFLKKKLKIGGIINITVIDFDTGSPLKGVNFIIPNVNTRLKKECISNEEGKFKLSQLSIGEYSIISELIGYGSQYTKVTIDFEEVKNISIFFNSKSKTMVSGIVKCKDTGIPLSNIVVSLYRKEPYLFGKSYTDENGFFSIKDLKPGSFSIGIVALKAGEWIDEDEEFSDSLIQKIIVVNEDENRVVNFNVDCSFEYESKNNELRYTQKLCSE